MNTAKYDRAQKRITQKVDWYRKHHDTRDDINYQEMKVLADIAEAAPIDALYDCFRFAFAVGYQAAQRDAKKEGAKTI